MAKKVILSSLGVDITEATITSITKNEGSKVRRGDVIALVETQKVSFEVVSPANGTLLKLLCRVGDIINTGEIVAIIGEEGEDISNIIGKISKDINKRKGGYNEDNIKKELTFIKSNRNKAYPSAKKLAEELGLDIYDIEGTGPDGVITKEDVKNYSNKTDFLETIPLIGIRGTIANRMLESLKEAAHVTTVIEVDMTSIIQLRNKFLEKRNQRISFTAFIIRAAVKAIKDVPIVNSTIKDDKIIKRKEINFGVAVGTEEALLVPVIYNVEEMDFREINSKLNEIKNLIKDKKVSTKNMKNGTITISNGGIFGPIINTPIINQPQVAIIWTGRIEKRAVVFDNKIVPRDMMYLCMSYDHRVMDGRDAGTFISKMKKYLEDNYLIV